MPETTLLHGAEESSDESERFREIIKLIRGFFKYSHEHNIESNYRTEAEEDFDFVRGKQWTEADIKRLDEEHHPHLVINRIKKQVNTIKGFHRQNRLDIKPIPVDGSAHDLGISSLYQLLIKHSMAQNKGHWHITQAFDECTIGGLGYVVPSLDFTRDIENGEPFLEWVPWREIYVDPDSKMHDKSDATYFMRWQWMTEWELKELYPDHADAIKAGFGEAFPGEDQQTPLKSGDETDAYTTPDKDMVFADKKNKRIRVIDSWYRKAVKRKVLIDQDTGEVDVVFDEDEVERHRQNVGPERAERIRIETRTMTEIHFALVAPGLRLLFEEGISPYDDHPILRTMLPIIPFVWDVIDGHPEGLVRQLKDPQRETNKRRSQHMHLLNTLATGGWIADEGAIDPKDMENKIRKSNFVLYKRKGYEIDRISAPEPGAIFISVDQESKADIFDIGINPDLMGLDSGAESGRAIMLKLTQGQLQIGGPMDNLQWSYKLVGLWLMGLIQMSYTMPRVLQVTGDDGAEILLSINQKDPQGKVVNTVNNGSAPEPQSFGDFRTLKYDVIISTSPFAPSARMAQFAMLADMANSGYPIPAQFLIEASDLPNRQELIKALGPLTPSPGDQPSEVVQEAVGNRGAAQPQ